MSLSVLQQIGVLKQSLNIPIHSKTTSEVSSVSASTEQQKVNVTVEKAKKSVLDQIKEQTKPSVETLTSNFSTSNSDPKQVVLFGGQLTINKSL